MRLDHSSRSRESRKSIRIYSLFAAVLFLTSANMLFGQWLRFYLGEENPGIGQKRSNRINALVPDEDGGFLAACDDNWLVKIGPNGLIQWQKIFNGNGSQRLNDAIQAADHGYVISGENKVLKTDQSGNPEWNRSYGLVTINALCPADGANFLAVGQTVSSKADTDAVIMKIGPTGGILWQKSLGGEFADSANALTATGDGGSIFAGYCTSLAPGNGQDLWIVKLDASGGVEWQKNYGGVWEESASSIAISGDGGYYVGGATTSFGAGGWVMKIDSYGNILWQRHMGTHFTSSVAAVAGEGVIATAGPLLAKLSDQGNVIWQKSLPEAGPGFSTPRFAAVFTAADGFTTAAGRVIGNETGTQEWGLAARVDENGQIGSCGYLQDAHDPFTETQASAQTSHVIPTSMSLVPSDSLAIPRGGMGQSMLICPAPNPAVDLSLWPSRLNFASIVSGPATPPQSFFVKNPAGSAFHWSIDQVLAWLAFSPSSGSGESSVRVTANPAGLAPGFYRTSVAVNSPEAELSPLYLEATMLVKPAGSSQPPFGFMDTPITGSTVSGSVPVTGWALDDIGISTVQIWRRAVAGESPSGGLIYIGQATFVEGARPDIETAYPDFPSSNQGGWGYLLLSNMLPGQGNGYFALSAIAADLEGNETLLGEKTIYVDNEHAVKPFGTIDTPAQGGDVSTNPFVNFGWVLTPLGKTIPLDGSTISVWVDSVRLGTLKDPPNAYNQYRPDVAAAFPGLSNSGGPVGYFYLDISVYGVGTHSIFWIATDDHGAAEGIGSRFFNVTGGGPSEPMSAARSARGFSRSFPPAQVGPLRIRTGFGPNGEPREISPDQKGIYRIELPEIDRIEIELGDRAAKKRPASERRFRYAGFSIVNGEDRPLPIGSNLDPASGIFSWIPGPGFFGTYRLVFIKTDLRGQEKTVTVELKIIPK